MYKVKKHRGIIKGHLPWKTAIQENQCWDSHAPLLEAHEHWICTQFRQSLIQSDQFLQYPESLV